MAEETLGRHHPSFVEKLFRGSALSRVKEPLNKLECELDRKRSRIVLNDVRKVLRHDRRRRWDRGHGQPAWTYVETSGRKGRGVRYTAQS